MARRGDYIFRPVNSDVWHARRQGPEGRIEFSLHTRDRQEALSLVEPYASKWRAEARARAIARRPRLVSQAFTLEPGEYVSEAGERIVATASDLVYFDRETNAFLRTVPNSPSHKIINAPQGVVLHGGERSTAELHEIAAGRPIIDLREHRTPKNDDDDLIDIYIREAGLTGYPEKECRNTWADFRKLNPNVKLKNADRDHGRKLRDFYLDKGNSPATAQHKIARLAAACNFAIKERKLVYNPFSGVVTVPEKAAEERRQPFSDDDMKAIRANLDALRPADQLLIRTLGCTGMGMDEAWQINGEKKEGGVRYVIVGSKTAARPRRIPLPADLLPHLPKRITGKLFPEGNTHNASTRLMRWLRKEDGCNIQDPLKVLYSFRHRAADKLRAAGCPEPEQDAILGHNKKTVSRGYGLGFQVTKLKDWIDRIGF